MRTTWTIALALLAAGPLLMLSAADDVEPTGGPVKDRDGFIPQRKFVALKGKAIGVLVSDVKAVMAHDGRGGPPAEKPGEAKKKKSPAVLDLEARLQRRLGTKAEVEDENGSGRILLAYGSLDELDRIIRAIGA